MWRNVYRLLTIIGILTIIHDPGFSQADTKVDVEEDVVIPVVHKKQRRLVLFPVIVKSPEYLWGAGGYSCA